MIGSYMSATQTVRISSEIEEVWENLSALGFFAKLFTGVSEVDSVQGYKTDQRVQMKGKFAGSEFSSSVTVEYRLDEERKVAYRSGQTVYEIDLKEEGKETTLNLTMRSQNQDRFMLLIYSKSLANKIKNMLEG